MLKTSFQIRDYECAWVESNSIRRHWCPADFRVWSWGVQVISKFSSGSCQCRTKLKTTFPVDCECIERAESIDSRQLSMFCSSSWSDVLYFQENSTGVKSVTDFSFSRCVEVYFADMSIAAGVLIYVNYQYFVPLVPLLFTFRSERYDAIYSIFNGTSDHPRVVVDIRSVSDKLSLTSATRILFDVKWCLTSYEWRLDESRTNVQYLKWRATLDTSCKRTKKNSILRIPWTWKTQSSRAKSAVFHQI